MAFCNKCGAEIPNGAAFCPACGNASVQPQEPKQAYYTEPVNYSAPAVEEDKSKSVFGMGLASAIMAWFPITSIVSIILGSIARKNFGKVYNSGAQVGGKLRVGGILGKVGLIAGIIMTIFWLFYIILIAALVA